MSNDDDIDDRNDRRSALDAFATAGREDRDEESRALMIPAQAFSSDLSRAIGAQQVAVMRDEARVLSKLKVLAAAAGTDWFYRWPVKNKDGSQSFVEGPSIKLCNDLARLYGNCDVDIQCVDLGHAYLFKARFVDYETGFSLARLFQQRKNQRTMKTDADRQADIVFQIGQSKAQRNVVRNALQTFADFALEEARGSIIEKIGKDLQRYRDRIVSALSREKIDVLRVERVMGRKAADWLATDVAEIIAMMKGVADGMASWEDTFPPLDQAAPQPVTEIKADDNVKPAPQSASDNLKAEAAAAEAKATAKEKKKTSPAPRQEPVDQGAGEAPARQSSTPAPAQQSAPPAPASTAAPEATEAKPAPSSPQAEPSAAPSAQGGEAAAAPVAGAAQSSGDAAPAQISAEDRTRLMAYSERLMGSMSSSGLQRRTSEFFANEVPDESTPLGALVQQIFDLHTERTKQRQGYGPTDVQKTVKAFLA